MENTIKVKVMECTRKEFEGRVYFILLVHGQNVPLGKIACNKAFKVGDEVTLSVGRKEQDMKLVLRVNYEN